MPLLLNAATNPGTAQWTEASDLGLTSFVQVINQQTLGVAGSFSQVTFSKKWRVVEVYFAVLSTRLTGGNGDDLQMQVNGSTSYDSAGYFGSSVWTTYANINYPIVGRIGSAALGTKFSQAIARMVDPMNSTVGFTVSCTSETVLADYSSGTNWSGTRMGFVNNVAGPLATIDIISTGFAAGSSMTVLGYGEYA